jgi:hypothetical protein
MLSAAEIDLNNGLFNGFVWGVCVPGRYVRFGAASLIPERQFIGSQGIIFRNAKPITVIGFKTYFDLVI